MRGARCEVRGARCEVRGARCESKHARKRADPSSLRLPAQHAACSTYVRRQLDEPDFVALLQLLVTERRIGQGICARLCRRHGISSSSSLRETVPREGRERMRREADGGRAATRKRRPGRAESTGSRRVWGRGGAKKRDKSGVGLSGMPATRRASPRGERRNKRVTDRHRSQHRMPRSDINEGERGSGAA